MEQILIASNLCHYLEVPKCKRTGTCCRLFVFTGVSVTDKEWEIIEPDIQSLKLAPDIFEVNKRRKTLPTIGETPPKQCPFLKNGNGCLIYSIRPSRCREYPVMISEKKNAVVFHISTDCQRGKEIAKIIMSKPPNKIRRNDQFYPFILTQPVQDCSDLFLQSPIYYFTPFLRHPYNMIFAFLYRMR